MDNDEEVKKAVHYYEKQRQAQLRYRQKNKEKLNELGKSYYRKIKEDPEKYEIYLKTCNKKYEKIKSDPETYKQHLEKVKARYYLKKQQAKAQASDAVSLDTL
jgi:hypothetical protein